MKIKSVIKNLQWVLLAWFVVFCVFPVPVPAVVGAAVDSPLGMCAVFLVGVALFVYTHPAVAVGYVIYAWVLLKRSTQVKAPDVLGYAVTDTKKDRYMKDMNLPKQLSLEEEVINAAAPVGKDTKTNDVVRTSFLPVADDDHHAMVLH